jgi:hypothetical protein
MKELIKIICIITIIVIGNKSYGQQCVLNMSNVFDDHGCNVWCWVHTSQNIINYYGEASPDELDIVEWVRINQYYPNDTSCYDFPNSCCKTGDAVNVLNYLVYPNYSRIYTSYISGTITGFQFYEEFCYNKPVIIDVPGHFFIAYGINSTRSLVHTMDAFYGLQIRNITDIYPGKPWESTRVMKHSPNWSSYNIIRGNFEKSRCFSSQNGMRVNAVFNKFQSSPIQNFTLSTFGTVELNEGFAVHPGCSLDIFTNNSNCP